MAKFEVNNVSVSTLLGYVSDGTIAIPEIQRPFVWDTTKVRDLIDSLYKEFPVGYIITWKSPDVKLKDGTASEGKQILIDGQQRITALTAALLGKEVLDIYLAPSILTKYTYEQLGESIQSLRGSGMDPKEVPLMAY